MKTKYFRSLFQQIHQGLDCNVDLMEEFDVLQCGPRSHSLCHIGRTSQFTSLMLPIEDRGRIFWASYLSPSDLFSRKESGRVRVIHHKRFGQWATGYCHYSSMVWWGGKAGVEGVGSSYGAWRDDSGGTNAKWRGGDGGGTCYIIYESQ